MFCTIGVQFLVTAKIQLIFKNNKEKNLVFSVMLSANATPPTEGLARFCCEVEFFFGRSPIDTTEPGIIIELKPQPEKALLPIEEILSKFIE